MKNDIDVHRTNATIFFMSEYAYRHLWYIHGGQSLFDYVDWLEEIFKEFGFLRVHVSYIVNSKYIVAWYKDEVELINKVLILIA